MKISSEKNSSSAEDKNSEREVPNFALMGAIPNFIPPKTKPEDEKKPPRSKK